MKETLDRASSVIFLAAGLGFVIGLFEGATDIVRGSVVDSRLLPMSSQLAPMTKFLYIAFVTALYGLLFQLVGIASSIPLFLGNRRDESFRKKIAPYWIFFVCIFALLLFANISHALAAEISSIHIAETAAVHTIFVILCRWQIRSLCKGALDVDIDDIAQTITKHKARISAYILLTSFMIVLSNLLEGMKSPLALGAMMAGILATLYPLATVTEMILVSASPVLDRLRWRGSAFPVLFLVVAISLTIVFSLWNLYPEETILSSRFGKTSTENSPQSPNVIILLIDMARADHFSCYGYSRPTTPNIDGLASRGVLFHNAFSEASWTRPSTVTLLSGLHPAVHGADSLNGLLSDEATTMAEVFASNGYRTGAFVCNPVLGGNLNIFQGFDDYFLDWVARTYSEAAGDSKGILSKIIAGSKSLKLIFFQNYDVIMENPEETEWAPFDFDGHQMMGIDHVNEWALKWIEENRDSPFFLYMHYLDVHGPYSPQRPFENDFSGDELAETVNLYDGALRHIDTNIALFVDRLERMGIRDDSIIIITSDHGEEFNEHGNVGHGETLFEEQLQVPLIFVHTRAFPFRGTVLEPVGLVDVLPTLIEYLNLITPKLNLNGKSFASSFSTGRWPDAPDYRYAATNFIKFSAARPYPISLESVTRENRWKYIYDNKLRKAQLFDLTQDPDEHTNLAEREPAIVMELKSKLEERRAESRKQALPKEAEPIGEARREILKGLGYLQ